MSEISSESTLILHNDSADFKDYTSIEDCFSSSDETDFFDESESQQMRLREKIAALQITLNTLKDQVQKETELWKKEVEEIKVIEEKFADMLESCCEQCGKTTREMLESQACVYQQAILKAQAAKKARMQREIAITSYKTQLLQVENMCNLELTRMKQSKQSLEPLQMIASEWSKGDGAKINETKSESMTRKASSIMIERSVSELKTELDQMLSEIGDKFAAVPIHMLNANQEN